MIKRLSLIIFSLLVISLTASTPTVTAQSTGLRLTTSPLPVNLSAKPGQTVTTDLRIRNSGSQPETLKVGLLKFSADGQTGQAKLDERQPSDDYFDWVTFSDKEFTLAPNQWHTTKMTIKVPKEAAFGYYYAATFSRVDKTGQQASQQAVVVGSTATLVLLEVESPNARRQIDLQSFVTDKSWYEFLPTNFTVTLKNSGNVHALVSGNIFITKGDQAVATIEVNQLKGSILPDSIRQFTSAWQTGFPYYEAKKDASGNTKYTQPGQPDYQLKWDFSQADKLRFGKYTARIVLAYDNGTRDVPLEATVDFWVIPWRLILAAIAIPVIPAVIVYLFMRWKFKKAVSDEL